MSQNPIRFFLSEHFQESKFIYDIKKCLRILSSLRNEQTLASVLKNSPKSLVEFFHSKFTDHKLKKGLE